MPRFVFVVFFNTDAPLACHETVTHAEEKIQAPEEQRHYGGEKILQGYQFADIQSTRVPGEQISRDKTDSVIWKHVTEEKLEEESN